MISVLLVTTQSVGSFSYFQCVWCTVTGGWKVVGIVTSWGWGRVKKFSRHGIAPHDPHTLRFNFYPELDKVTSRRNSSKLWFRQWLENVLPLWCTISNSLHDK